MNPFYIIEDKDGCLALAIYNKEHSRLIYLNQSYGDNPGMLRDDLKRFASGENPETMWDGNEITRTKTEYPYQLKTYFPDDEQKGLCNNKGRQWRIIANENGIWPQQMGEIGKQELSQSDYYKWIHLPKRRNVCQNCPYDTPIFISEIEGDICEGICSPYGCYKAINDD